MSSLKNTCINCGKSGHQYKKCNEPIISYGIICFNINKDLGIYQKNIDKYFYNKYIDISEYNYVNLNNIKLIPYYYDKIKILMIRRKHSLNYVDFIRGKYDVNNKEHLIKIFNLMSQEENIKIKTTNFEYLWNNLWQNTAINKIYQKEYEISRLKYNELQHYNFYNLLDNNLSQYLEPEWEFPKGRRNMSEKNIDCALREFNEETNINLNDINILERINCTNEDYIGTNLINYRHTYYLASCTNEIELNIDNENQSYEIGALEWLTIPQAIEKIRTYYDKRVKMIHQLYFFILNLIINIMDIKNSNQLSFSLAY